MHCALSRHSRMADISSFITQQWRQHTQNPWVNVLGCCNVIFPGIHQALYPSYNTCQHQWRPLCCWQRVSSSDVDSRPYYLHSTSILKRSSAKPEVLRSMSCDPRSPHPPQEKHKNNPRATQGTDINTRPMLSRWCGWLNVWCVWCVWRGPCGWLNALRWGGFSEHIF